MRNLFIICLILISTTIQAQNVWIADNNYNAPSGPNVFSTVQAAINAASAGDIVQVQPSPNAYGNAVINKQITLMGIGFNVNKDNPITSTMGNITLTNELAVISDSDGTIITGLSFGILYTGSNTGSPYTLENILIENCQFSYLYTTNVGYSPIDGLEIRDCYITSSSTGLALFFYMPASNILIRNSLILNDIGFLSSTTGASNVIANNLLYGGIRVNATSTNTLIHNNNFIGATGSETAFVNEIKDCDINNNIFYGSTPSIAVAGTSSANFQNNTFTNNIVYATGDDTMPPTGTGNTSTGHIVASPDFTNSQLLDSWSSSYDFTLEVTSPGLGAGNDATDIGLTGGISYFWTDPNFILKTTAIPVIQILNTGTIVNENDILPIRVKGKSN